MSRKNKGGQFKQPSVGQVRHLLDKGDVKTALKSAKCLYRGAPNSEHLDLLGSSYVHRIDQLLRFHANDEARALFEQLRELKPMGERVAAELSRLRVLLGMPGSDVQAVLSADPMLLANSLDRAVLDSRYVIPAQLNSAQVNLTAEVALIREALEAVAQGNDERATELLKDISRTSPAADWKIFVRGLSAFYAADKTRCEQNWLRLDSQRPAHRIATSLRVAAGELPADQAGFPVSTNLRRIALFTSDPAREALRGLSRSWQARKSSDNFVRDFVRDFRGLSQRFGKTHPELVAAVSECCWIEAVREDDDEFFEKIAAFAPPPRLDPRWNRARAMLEESNFHDGEHGSDKYWLAYLDDLRHMDCLPVEQRTAAMGMVHARMADSKMMLIERFRKSWVYQESNDTARKLLKDAKRNYRECVSLFPEYADVYQRLAIVLTLDGEPDEAMAVRQQLLNLRPDDFKTHVEVASYFIHHRDSARAEPHISAALRLKPRDPGALTLRWNQHAFASYALIESGQFEAARRELAEGRSLSAINPSPFAWDVWAAALEFKAGEFELAEKYLDGAKAKAGEPTAVWLAMCRLAHQVRLPQKLKREFAGNYKKAIQQPFRSATAGQLGVLFRSVAIFETQYPGLKTQEALFEKYLKRAPLTGWTEHDLLQVTQYLSERDSGVRLFESLVRTGYQKFPNAPHFILWHVEKQIGLVSPWNTIQTQRLIGQLETARRLSETAQFPLSPEDLEQLDECLLRLRSQAEDPYSPWNDPYDSGYEDEDDFEDGDVYEDEYEDDDELGGFFRAGGDEQTEFAFTKEMLSNEMLDEAFATMPPELKKMVREMADRMNCDPRDIVRRVLSANFSKHFNFK